MYIFKSVLLCGDNLHVEIKKSQANSLIEHIYYTRYDLGSPFNDAVTSTCDSFKNSKYLYRIKMFFSLLINLCFITKRTFNLLLILV